MAQYELVAEGQQCSGEKISKGRPAKVEECAAQCKNVSSMFMFGIGNKCDSDGCVCWCEKTASADGTCYQADISGYNLYRFVLNGNILFV